MPSALSRNNTATPWPLIESRRFQRVDDAVNAGVVEAEDHEELEQRTAVEEAVWGDPDTEEEHVDLYRSPADDEYDDDDKHHSDDAGSGDEMEGRRRVLGLRPELLRFSAQHARDGDLRDDHDSHRNEESERHQEASGEDEHGVGGELDGARVRVGVEDVGETPDGAHRRRRHPNRADDDVDAALGHDALEIDRVRDRDESLHRDGGERVDGRVDRHPLPGGGGGGH